MEAVSVGIRAMALAWRMGLGGMGGDGPWVITGSV